jgi:hypothetical protein
VLLLTCLFTGGDEPSTLSMKAQQLDSDAKLRLLLARLLTGLPAFRPLYTRHVHL